MKYFVGTLNITEHASHRDHSRHVLIAANGIPQALKALEAFAGEWDSDPEKVDDGKFRYSAGDDPYDVQALPVDELDEITPAAFLGMKGLTRIGNDAPGNLAEQSASEQAKTLSRRIGNQLAGLGIEGVSHGKLLSAVAASLGETDWQVLKHKATHSPEGDATEVADQNAHPNSVVTLQLGIATHHHKHGEDVFLFQDAPSLDEAIEAVNASSSFEPENNESIDTGFIHVTVDASWLASQLTEQAAPPVARKIKP